jgi:hypothetical protein
MYVVCSNANNELRIFLYSRSEYVLFGLGEDFVLIKHVLEVLFCWLMGLSVGGVDLNF